jgi:HPt (histidine-containing phosphotransfer) domain-containing protein
MNRLNEKTIQEIRRAAGESVLRELFEVFLSASEPRRKAALDAVKNQDSAAGEMAFHSIRSSSATIGLQFLSERAALLEDLVAQGAWDEVRRALRQFKEEFAVSVKCLQTELASLSDET